MSSHHNWQYIQMLSAEVCDKNQEEKKSTEGTK